MYSSLRAIMQPNGEHHAEPQPTAEDLVDALSLARQTIDCLGKVTQLIALRSRNGSRSHKLAMVATEVVSLYFRKTQGAEREVVADGKGSHHDSV